MRIRIRIRITITTITSKAVHLATVLASHGIPPVLSHSPTWRPVKRITTTIIIDIPSDTITITPQGWLRPYGSQL